MADKTATTPTPSSDQKKQARTFYLENKKMNAAKRSSEAERKRLFNGLEADALGNFTFNTTDENNRQLRLEVEVKTPEVEYIDIETLRGLVPMAKFLKIVSASKEKVEEHAGKAVAVQATKTKEGTRNVFVKPVA